MNGVEGATSAHEKTKVHKSSLKKTEQEDRQIIIVTVENGEL